MKYTFIFLRNVLLLCCLLIANRSFTQGPGSIDPAFTTMPGPSNGTPYCVVVQPNSKILMGGGFESFDNEPYGYLARANDDGSLDTSFNTHLALDGVVNAMILLSDGKVLIAGEFTTYNGVSRNYIARINSDGTLDTSFNPGTGAGYTITCMVQQPDGKIIIGGLFNTYNGVNRVRIARLNADGSLDTTFNPGTGADSSVHTIALQSDGKILVGGLFENFNNVEQKSIVRLNANGSIDTTFDIGTSGLGVLSIVMQPDNKILIGGFFSTFNGIARNRIARLNADGSVDTTFDPGIGANHIVLWVALLPNGKILTGGQFFNYNGGTDNYLTSLNADGSPDNLFNFGTGPNDWVYRMFPQSNGKIFVTGNFETFNNESYNSIVRLNGLCNTPAPQGETTQIVAVNAMDEATIEDLVVTGTEIKWYDALGNMLPLDTQLINGTTYYATQTLDECESAPLAVTTEVVLGMDENTKTKFVYYPNPVTDKLYITSESNINQIEIYTVYGQKIVSQTGNAMNGILDMGQLAIAAYIVRIYCEDKTNSFIVTKSN